MSSKKRIAYMHTIDREPAIFDGYQVCFAGKIIDRFADSLKQIYREQKASARFREVHKLGTTPYRYGHKRVKLPEASQ